MRKSLFATVLAVPAFLFINSANAAPITGQANIAGNVDVSASAIEFSPAFTNTAGAMETGSFAGLTGGTIQSLMGGAMTGNVSVPAFATFTAGVALPITFDLTYIAPGVGTVAGCSSSVLGSACTPAGSPFTLFQITSNTVVATLQLNGVSYTGSAATGTSPTNGVFSTQMVASGTVPQIYQTLVSGGSINGITYSASFIATNPIPEPASLALLGLGLVGAGILARRKTKSNS